jgi:ubiquinone/menaquinone biosynthesis C-methylase UbiE
MQLPQSAIYYQKECTMDAAEFDRFADEYDLMHEKSIAITGEKPEFFHEYKIKVLVRLARQRNLRPESILDFGSGIGNSTPFFRRDFPAAQLASADVSQRSLDVAESRFAGMSTGLRIEDSRIPAKDDAFGIAFSACVFHHIPHEEHIGWLRELRRVTRIGGMLAIFEHNPLNPLTVRTVDRCPFDENARLIKAKEFVARCRESGWKDAKAQYHLFFPHALSGLRTLEPYLSGIPFGGQYSVTAIKSD